MRIKRGFGKREKGDDFVAQDPVKEILLVKVAFYLRPSQSTSCTSQMRLYPFSRKEKVA